MITRTGSERTPPPGEVAEVKRLVRHVTVWRRRVYGWQWVDISDEDLDYVETSGWPNDNCDTTNNSPFGPVSSAMVYHFACPSGRTYTVHVPLTGKHDDVVWLHSWCLTSEWVPPPKAEKKTPSWPEATAEPVLKVKT